MTFGFVQQHDMCPTSGELVNTNKDVPTRGFKYLCWQFPFLFRVMNGATERRGARSRIYDKQSIPRNHKDLSGANNNKWNAIEISISCRIVGTMSYAG